MSEHSVSSDAMLESMDFRADDFVCTMENFLADLSKPGKHWDENEDSRSEDMAASVCLLFYLLRALSEGEDEVMAEVIKKHTIAPESKLHQLMNQMSAKLAGPDEEGHEDFDDVESFEPVDVDTTALMLKSFQSQEIPPGPSTNLLQSVCFDISRAAGASSSSISQPEVAKEDT